MFSGKHISLILCLEKKGQIFMNCIQILSAFPIMLAGQINTMASTLQTCLALTGWHFKHPFFPRVMYISELHFQDYSKAH